MLSPASTLLALTAALAGGGLLVTAQGRWRRRRGAGGAGADAWRLARLERDFAVAGLGAEVAHELATSRLFLRDLVARAPLEATDRDIGRDEVERLERLLARLRGLRRAPEALGEQPLLPAVQRALGHLPPREDVRLQVAVEVPADLAVPAGPEALDVLLTSLLRGAAARSAGHLAVRGRAGPDGAQLEVEDDGAALPAQPGAPGFHPLDLLPLGGAGLELLVALGVARAHGGRLACQREQGRTRVRVQLPAGAAARRGAA